MTQFATHVWARDYGALAQCISVAIDESLRHSGQPVCIMLDAVSYSREDVAERLLEESSYNEDGSIYYYGEDHEGREWCVCV